MVVHEVVEEVEAGEEEEVLVESISPLARTTQS